MRIRTALLASAIALATAMPAHADDDYTFMGIGVKSCGWWTEARRVSVAETAAQWVLGFISGVGFAGAGDPLRDLDAYAVLGWFDNHCRAHPTLRLSRAAAAFVEAFSHDQPAASAAPAVRGRHS